MADNNRGDRPDVGYKPVVIKYPNSKADKQITRTKTPPNDDDGVNRQPGTGDSVKPKGSSIIAHSAFVPDTNLTLACLVCICFNLPLGVIAMYMSLSAARLYRDGHPKQGERKAKCSVIISLFSIVTTVLLVMSYVLWVVIQTQNKRELRKSGSS